MPDRISAYAKGVMGENTALHHLSEKGFHLLEQRYRAPDGEIDLIMLDGDVLVFIEVKAREGSTREAAQYAVTPSKQRRMMNTVRYYLGEHPEHVNRMMRFDIVTVARDGILHIPNAFEGTPW